MFTKSGSVPGWIRDLSVFIVFVMSGCMVTDYHKNSSSGFRQSNLVSDTAGIPAKSQDADLANAWGIAVGAGGTFWIADNHSGKSTLYDRNGNTQGTPVSIPGAHDPVGAPTGVVYNATPDFPMPDGSGKALFIFAGEDGSLSAWNSGASAKIVATPSDSGTVYKGLAMAASAGKNFLYVANFKGRAVDVFDAAFHRDTTMSFRDSTLPADYGPFNIAVIGNDLFVSYAKLNPPDNEDDQAGPGNGFINEFKTDGTLVRRFVSGGGLNSPWGMVSVPGTFGPFKDGIFVGNFGDGFIHVYDTQGNLLGQAQDSSGNAISIEGLWGLYYSSTSDYGGASNQLYFTAGPDDENHGVFGYLAPR
ncbi:MAG: TIGR03118 family protein [Fibrobacteres bacterium]|nr:TIGR03118 family protein [Fibrobacterota bacterium]